MNVVLWIIGVLGWVLFAFVYLDAREQRRLRRQQARRIQELAGELERNFRRARRG